MDDGKERGRTVEWARVVRNVRLDGAADTQIRCECCTGRCRSGPRINGYEYWRCAMCGYTFLPGTIDSRYTEDVYDDRYFSDGGAGYSGYDGSFALHRRHGLELGRMLSAHALPGSLLDVGCAAGGMLVGFREAGWRAEGLEPNRTMAAAAEKHGFRVHVAAIESPIADLRGKFQAVTMLQVFAHVRSASEALRNASEYLSPNGLLLIETWNARSLTARLFGEQWHELSPPQTLRVATPSGLRALALRHGFHFIAGGRPRKWLLVSHAKSALEHKSSSGVLMAGLSAIARNVPDGLALPYPFDDVFWHLYQLG